MNTQTSKALGLSMLCQLLLYCVYSLAITLCAPLGKIAVGIISCFLYAAVFTFPLLTYLKAERTSLLKLLLIDKENTNERTRNRKNHVSLLIFGFAVTVTVINLVSMSTDAVYSLFGAKKPAVKIMNTGELICLFIQNVVLAAILEELLFRGAVLDAAKDAGRVKKILLSALLFALMHCSLRSFFYAFAAGAVIAYFSIRANSVLLGIGIHFLQNLTTYIFSVLMQTTDATVYNTVSLVCFLVLLAIAAIGVFEAVFFEVKSRHDAHAKKETAKIINAKSFISNKKSERNFPIELIGYIIISAILTVINF